ncbi:MAG: peptidylprolyl isomerase [Acidobacteriota bacterium]
MTDPQPRPSWAKRLAREPLFVFLLLGLAVFLVERSVAGRFPDNDAIVVDELQLDRLQKLWQTQTRRAPTEQELDALVQDFVREEVLYREALRLGLDRDDTIIRRRLAQKMGFLLDDTAEISEPSDADLEGYFEANLDRYLEPRRTSFRHVYVRRDRDGGEDAALRFAQQLEGDDDEWRGLGDPFMLQREYAERSDAELGELFGQDFVRALAEAPLGRWSAPVASAYGHHAVQVVSRREAHDPGFTAARSRVRDDYLIDERRDITGAAYDKIRATYDVVYEASEAGED